jgi:hypothetical protein
LAWWVAREITQPVEELTPRQASVGFPFAVRAWPSVNFSTGFLFARRAAQAAERM